MKYKFEIKKENRSIIWKILLVMIYFSFYAVSIRLFMTYFPFINKELIIVVGVLVYLFIILPMVFTPKWYLSNNSILISTTIRFNRNLGVFHFKKRYTRN